MKLSNYQQQNTNEAVSALKLILSAANEESEHPEDQDRTRNRSYQDTSFSSCKQKLIKKALLDPYGALVCWFNSSPTNAEDAYNPRQLMPNPAPLWDAFVADVIGVLDNNPTLEDTKLVYKQVCTLAATATNMARHPVLNSQKKLDWVVMSHEYIQHLAPLICELESNVYNVYSKLNP
jgi:hypothetical protein